MRCYEDIEMTTPMKKLQDKYDHALDRLWVLFKIGREREHALEDELAMIKVVCNQAKSTTAPNGQYFDEILDLCDRGLSS